MKKISFLSLLFIHPAFAEMMCDISVTDYYAGYAINTYNCGPGQFLPANALGCAPCPNGFTCPGGTFEFNPDYFQGLNFDSVPPTQMNDVCAANFPSDLVAIYKPNTHTCSPGYYLPANAIECTECLMNSACVGGTYSFNETADQGIQSCASGTFAPTGSTVCYPHRLHVGDDIVYVRSTKLTTPSLNIDMNQDGIADFFINMTTTRTRMNKDSTHYLHADWGGNHYYICDDTTCPQ